MHCLVMTITNAVSLWYANYHLKFESSENVPRKSISPGNIAMSMKSLSSQPNCPLASRCASEYYEIHHSEFTSNRYILENMMSRH